MSWSSGLPWLNVDFLTGVPSRRPENAGIWPALVGSIELAILVGLVTFPLGIGAAIYLAEYAPDNRLHPAPADEHQQPGGRAVDHLRHLRPGHLRPPARASARSCFPAPLTLALVILPLVIIASIEALKAVPQAQREGAYALGASRWQMVRGSVLPGGGAGDHDRDHPGHGPGHRRGRAARRRRRGDVRPGHPPAVRGRVHGAAHPDLRLGPAPQEDFQGIAAATIIVVLVLIFILNLLALDRARPPVQAHPVVEETPVNAAQAGSTLDAPVDGTPDTDPFVPSIKIATEPDAIARATPQTAARPSSSSATCRATTARSGR